MRFRANLVYSPIWNNCFKLFLTKYSMSSRISTSSPDKFLSPLISRNPVPPYNTIHQWNQTIKITYFTLIPPYITGSVLIISWPIYPQAWALQRPFVRLFVAASPSLWSYSFMLSLYLVSVSWDFSVLHIAGFVSWGRNFRTKLVEFLMVIRENGM